MSEQEKENLTKKATATLLSETVELTAADEDEAEIKTEAATSLEAPVDTPPEISPDPPGPSNVEPLNEVGAVEIPEDSETGEFTEPPAATTPKGDQEVLPAAPDWHKAENHSHHPIVGWAIGALVAILIMAGGAAMYFSPLALPGVSVGGQKVGGQNYKSIVSGLQSSEDSAKLELKSGDTVKTASLKDLGINVDVSSTARSAVKAKHSLAGIFMLGKKVDLDYVMTVDETTMRQFFNDNFGGVWQAPKEAGLSFNAETKQYDITPPIDGTSINIAFIKAQAVRSLSSNTPVPTELTSEPVKALLDEAAARPAQALANQLLKSDIKLYRGGQQLAWTFEPQEIAQILTINPDSKKQKLEVKVEDSRVKDFIDKQIAPTVASGVRDEIVLINPTDGSRYVFQKGVSGAGMVKTAELGKQVAEAMRSRKPATFQVDIANNANFASKTFTGTTRWMEVDLSDQMAYAHLDDQVIASYRISSGRAATPTDIGEWKVRAKVQMQTMAGVINGEAYRVPNVPWITYFNNTGEAFHGTYWHSNFGTPMSHGCVNMTIADAKTIYDFSYVGMRVSVHQ